MKKLLLLALLGSCTKDAAQSTGIQAVTCAEDSELTYDNFGDTFISENCLQCHNGDESPNLSTLAAIRTYSADILDMAVYSNAMPEDASMTTEVRELLGEWLACGAP